MSQQPPPGPPPGGNQGQAVPPSGPNPNNPQAAPRPPQPQPMAGPPPGFISPQQQQNIITHNAEITEIEKKEEQRTLIYSVIFVVAILVLGLLAGVLDAVIRNRDNAFLINIEEILRILASSAPWFALFFLLALGWVYIANRLFVKWNTSLNDKTDPAYGKGIIYEIVCDNNAAAAIMLIMPTLSIALVLIFIAILIAIP